ncbi:unnamed protein product [Meganyctiphanes norvegica]|uniref:Uncharacterized protein n=1 Tax=Meganyctiphanes norvegica TaxID=48144 RepID=A0AAV2SC00_MEGNR
MQQVRISIRVMNCILMVLGLRKNPTSSSSCMGSLKALATQKTGKIEECAKLEKYPLRKNPTSSSSCMGSLKALATQKTWKIEERAKLEKYPPGELSNPTQVFFFSFSDT